MEDLQYPIGKFHIDPEVTAEKRQAWIQRLADLPDRLRQAVDDLSEEQLNVPYRPEGWTVRQVVHHLADSHVNAYLRCRLALTEKKPRIKTYDQAAWAALEDAESGPIHPSLSLISGLHDRWVRLFRSLPAAEFGRLLDHPEWGDISVNNLAQMYAWHSDHHVAHITGLRRREGW